MICGQCLSLILLLSCVKTTDFEVPRTNCTQEVANLTSYKALQNMYLGEVMQIQENISIMGYVVSSDSSNNFFGELHVQDAQRSPTAGMVIQMDLRDTHLNYPVGSHVIIQLKGLYLGIREDAIQLGSAFNVFGNLSVGRIPASKVQDHILVACNSAVITPTLTSVAELSDKLLHTLIQLDSLEFIPTDLGKFYAEPREEALRVMIDCNKDELQLRNSGFADFQGEPLPEGNGSITGVLTKDGNDYQLVIRTLDDINFSNERCVDVPDEFTTDQLFISELADPDNNSGARFVELYNADANSFSLKGWTLRRYTNANTEVSSTIDLSELLIAGNGRLVISPNQEEFEKVYGFAPDLGVSTNSPADSNGDDNLELVDPFGKVIDAFGLVGEDGSGTNHEFEDGRAFRKANIIRANPIFTFEEWTIFNDTGEAGTTKAPQNAPEDFTPRAPN